MSQKSHVSVMSKTGSRAYQEDRCVFFPFDCKDDTGWLLAVMDGHGGHQVAELCANEIENLFQIVHACQAESALLTLIAELNKKTNWYTEGSTISVVCVLEKRQSVSIAVLGDSPVLVLDADGTFHVGPEHNVRSNEAEARAAQERGGMIMRGYLYAEMSYNAMGLQLSRALGDVELQSVLSREPDVFTIDNPEWIVVASDGLLDPHHGDTEQFLDEIKALGNADAGADDLVAWRETQGGLNDNTTAIVWSHA